MTEKTEASGPTVAQMAQALWSAHGFLAGFKEAPVEHESLAGEWFKNLGYIRQVANQLTLEAQAQETTSTNGASAKVADIASGIRAGEDSGANGLQDSAA